MANFVGSARSNYFEVRDEAAFLAWVEELPGVTAYNAEDGSDGRRRFTLLADDSDDGTWPSWRTVLQAGPFAYHDDDDDREALESWVAELPKGTRLVGGSEGLYLVSPEEAPWPEEEEPGLAPRLSTAPLGWLVARSARLRDAGETLKAALYAHMEYADDEIDVARELSEHLAEGSVAVLEEVGAERLRYLNGWAQAVDHRGEKITVTLDDVYAKAREAGWPEPTRAVY
jgi:hypothetical protein